MSCQSADPAGKAGCTRQAEMHRAMSSLLVMLLCRNQSIRGVPSVGLENAILQQAAATAAAGIARRDLQPQLSLGGLVSDLTAAAHNEAKVSTCPPPLPSFKGGLSQALGVHAAPHHHTYNAEAVPVLKLTSFCFGM